MAFLSGMAAALSGAGQQRAQNYQDALAERARVQALQQQQQQFDASQGLEQQRLTQSGKQFDASNALAKTYADIAAAQEGRTAAANRPPSPGDKYGGWEHQVNAMKPKAEAATLASYGLQNQQLQQVVNEQPFFDANRRQSEALANQMAALQVRNFQSPADIQAQREQLATFQSNLDESVFEKETRFQKALLTPNGGVDPKTAQTLYLKSLGGIKTWDDKLNGTTRGPSGVPIPNYDATTRQIVSMATQQIGAAADPNQKALQILASGAQANGVIRDNNLGGYLMDYAEMIYLQRIANGTNPTAQPSVNPMASRAGFPPLPAGGGSPYGLNLYGSQGQGGSGAPAPFPR